MKRTRRGFTIVELLIVIVVIAILAAITIVAYNGIQARAKDTRRASDMANIRKKIALFQADKGYYPSIDDFLNDANFRNNTLSIPDTLITSPGGSKMSYCWAYTSHNSGTKDPYCYVSYPKGGWAVNGSDCYASGSQCVGYTLTYWSDVNNDQVIIEVGEHS